MKFWDPNRYGGVRVGPDAGKPDTDHVPENTVWIATDTRAVYAAIEGEWVKVADLTAGIAWADILDKPSEFYPEKHDLEERHTGALDIKRVVGHDQWAPAHLNMSVLAMVIGKI